MKVFTRAEAEEWLKQTPLESDGRDIRFQNGPSLHLTVPLPREPYRITNLAHILQKVSFVSPFIESLLWMTDFGFWNEAHERAGRKMIELMRQALGESRSLIDAPAHLFSSDEEVEAQSFLVLPILLSWDAYLVPVTGDYFVFNSNDEFIEVVSRNEQIHRQFADRLKEWGATQG